MTKNRPRRPSAATARPVPVIDLFAGPGGLGEGFAASRASDGTANFRLALSVEKDPLAHQTLELRAFFRQFAAGKAPAEYFEYASGSLSRQELFRRYPEEAARARAEAWCAELGPDTRAELDARVRDVIMEAKASVLIGGPPCQAYSLVGRSRNRGIADYDPDTDSRHTLYLEYLHVIATQWPAVFVMENVKGLLSARFRNESMFERILRDLTDPASAFSEGGEAGLRSTHGGSSKSPNRHKYRLLHLARYDERKSHRGGNADVHAHTPRDFIVRAERHGVPQARHRVIILGVREDIALPEDLHLSMSNGPSVRDVIGALPRVRSGLSREADGLEEWRQALARWKVTGRMSEVAKSMKGAVAHAQRTNLSRGGEVLPRGTVSDGSRVPAALKRWYATASTPFILNHSTRAHIASDLHRYLFAASFAQSEGRSPTLADFPPALRPDHANAKVAIETQLFADRFRVQLSKAHSTTITSHISKDGHYYIHYDPAQCRSLTVREAARLQTFPDNYFFCGPRTAQYHQVGNAVPPYLAYQIAEVVARILRHHEQVTRAGDG